MTQIQLHDRAEIEQNSENKSYQSILGDPKTVFEPYPNPKNSPLGPQNVKNDPKIKSKSNVRVKRNKENESCSKIIFIYTFIYPSDKKQTLTLYSVTSVPIIHLIGLTEYIRFNYNAY